MRAVAPLARIQARSYPRETPPLALPTEVLSTQVFSRTRPRNTIRRRFGRTLDMDRIETALRSAYRGNMRDLTDIARETVDVDPHLGAVLNKRINAPASLPWECRPATGPGIDPELALFYAEVCTQSLKNLKAFRQNLRQLMWAVYDGRACLEIKWLQVATNVAPAGVGGRLKFAPESLAWIHPRRLSFGPSRELMILNEDDSSGGNFSSDGLPVDLMPDKFVHWTPQLFGEYPEREGLAVRCVYWSFFKRYSARERMILSELFGKPWRIIEFDTDSPADSIAMEDADEIIDALGSAYTARLPRGAKLNVVQPGHGSGAIHKDIISESDRQLSKLVLGQTGTTDGTPAGLNNNQANVMQDEQLMILQSDSHALAEAIECHLTDRIIALNFGEAATTHAPQFVLRADIPADRKAELERLQKTLEAGIAVKMEEAYEVSGFSQPNPDEDTILRIEQPPTPAGSPNAPNPRPVIVYPSGRSPAVGEQQPSPQTASTSAGSRADATADIVLTASDLGTVITVNEARASQNLGPLTAPDGQVDPDGELTISDFKEKKKAAIAAQERQDALEFAVANPGVDIPLASQNRESYRVVLAKHAVDVDRLIGHLQEIAIIDLAHCETCGVELNNDFKQQEGPTGDPEELVREGVPTASKVIGRFIKQYRRAVSGLESPTDIFNAVNRTAEQMDVKPLVTAFEKPMLHSFMMGALDGRAEQEGKLEPTTDVEPESEQAEALATMRANRIPEVQAAKIPNFAEMALREATKFFKELKVMPPAEFDAANAAVKRKAFSVAGVTNERMLALIHDELVQQIQKGGDLADFRTSLEARLTQAGFAPKLDANPTHVSTVFRTNTLNAYNAGRVKQASQPVVTRAFPTWEIRTARDRQVRPSHAKLHGKRLLANDPFWRNNYPPFDHNCRCRVVSRRTIANVVDGNDLDSPVRDGFASGTQTLL